MGEHVACMGERRGVYRVLVERTEGKRLLGRQSVDEMIILKWIFKNWDEEAWTGWIGLAQDRKRNGLL